MDNTKKDDQGGQTRKDGDTTKSNPDRSGDTRK